MNNRTSTIVHQPTAGSFVNIAAYKFLVLSDLEALRDRLKHVCKRLALRGTILLSGEGINLFLAGSRDGIDQFLQLLRGLEGFEDLEVKESYSAEQPFNRMLVKIKREIIAFGVENIDPARRTSPKLSAKQLKQWLDSGRPVRLLDVRNDYEVDLGTFQGAEQLGIQHFRQFPEASAQLPDAAKAAPLVMFCTGGIRCEKAGPMLEQIGFQHVYQLDGGILKYFEECGGAHYEGGCFVFDSRVVLNPNLEPTGAVQCFHCQNVLTHEDIQSPKFQFGRSCPHCFMTAEQHQQALLARRQVELSRIAQQQSGCRPYDNRRLMHVPKSRSGLTLFDFLCAYHPPTESQQWLAWIEEGSITSRGERVSPWHIVREGERFEQVQSGFTEPPVATDVRLLFEDEALIVIDKPAPLPVHPSGRYNRNTLLAMLAEVYRPEKLRVAHRLDANTTGLIVLARKYASARVLQPQFSAGQVQKVYLLRVQGHGAEDEFSCEAPITDEPSLLGGRTISDQGVAALTHFRVLERFADGTTLLEARPVTGRTNQIRIHAWHLGLPIVGDPFYLADHTIGVQQTRDVEASPMCLHAWQLRFLHPFTGAPVCFTAAPPAWHFYDQILASSSARPSRPTLPSIGG